MTFNHQTFLSQLGQAGAGSVGSWSQWSNTTGDLNQTSEFSYQGNQYRTWYQETSNMRDNIGMLVSCKIDFERSTGDDHIVILTGFSIVPGGIAMKFAQASVQFHGSEDNNVVGVPVTGGDMAQGIYDSLSSILNIDFGNVDDTTAGRHTLPDIARMNVQAMGHSVS